MATELFTRHFLGVFFLLIGVLFTARALGLYARLGYSQINYGTRGSRTWWNRQLFNLFRAAILGICLARIGFPVDPWLGIIPWLYQPPVLLAGVALLLASFAMASYIQAYLHVDWRSGIDEKQPPALVTSGPFSRSRNPTFIAIILGQTGFFLALPSLFSLLCLVVGVMVLYRQAKAEEAALERLHGDTYRRYRQAVRRWL